MLRRRSIVASLFVTTLTISALAQVPVAKQAAPAVSQLTLPSDIESQRVRAFSSLRADLKPKVGAAARVVAKRLSAPVPSTAKVIDPVGLARQAIVEANYFALATRADVDIDALVQLVMSECARLAEAEVRELLNELKKANEQKATIRGYLTTCKGDKACARMQPLPPETTRQQADQIIEDFANKKDTIDPVSKDVSLRIQSAQERMAKLVGVVRELLRRTADGGASAIVQNLK